MTLFFGIGQIFTKSISTQINTLCSEYSKQRVTRCKSILLHERTNCILYHGYTTSSTPRAPHEWIEHSGGQ